MSEQEQYNLPQSETVFLDTDSNEVVKQDEITPWMVIRTIAEKMGTPIREPRSNCSSCYGRGYIGFKPKTNASKDNVSILSKEPVPCPCIFTEEQKQKDVPLTMNRKQKRAMEKRFRLMKKRGQLKRTEDIK